MQIRDILTEKRLRQLEEMVATISPAELQIKFKDGELFTFIDVSDPDDFDAGHIPGAINIPLKELPLAAPVRFRKFQQLVVSGREANSSAETVAARMLQKAGFLNVLALAGGFEAWQNAALPVEAHKSESSNGKAEQV